MAQLDFGERMNDLFAPAGPARLAPIAAREPADPDRFVARLRAKYADRIAGELIVPARDARLAPYPADLDPGLRRALRARGIDSLYSHQRDGMGARARRPACRDRHADRLGQIALLQPAGARCRAGRARRRRSTSSRPRRLAQDQVAEILELNRAGKLGVRAYTFDGDTPGDARRAVRVHGDIVVSNPDMLHQAILPHHTKWAQFFENLRYVVIDELHTYRGVFGSHMANLLRRLKRICRFYRRDPIFILCSATIANPPELAERLIGAPVHADHRVRRAARAQALADLESAGGRMPISGLRASARSQSTRIARLAIKLGLKTIVFANTRLEVEVLTKYLKDVFDADPRKPARDRGLSRRLSADRAARQGGKLRAGDLDCVVVDLRARARRRYRRARCRAS